MEWVWARKSKNLKFLIQYKCSISKWDKERGRFLHVYNAPFWNLLFGNGGQNPGNWNGAAVASQHSVNRAVVRAWAAWAQAHVLKWLIAEKMQKMGYFHCIFLIWPTSCEKPNDGPVLNSKTSKVMASKVTDLARWQLGFRSRFS